jgi:hypothetical protein
MLHWSHKLPAVVLAALLIAAAIGHASPLGFHW